MRKLYVGILFILCVVVNVFVAANVRAASTNIVISQVQTGDTSSASNEFIELHNNSNVAVDISNWCLNYASASSTQAPTPTWSKLACFTPNEPSVHIFLPSHTYALATSHQLLSANPKFGGDVMFSAGLAATAGHVRLVDAGGAAVDKVGWGATAVAAEGSAPAPGPPTGMVLQRIFLDSTQYQDTDSNQLDFQLVAPRAVYIYGAMFDIQDVCLNISGIQEVVPTGYTVDDSGNCLPPPVDICPNIDDLQLVLPVGFGLDETGACVRDVCLNLAGLQATLPNGKELSQNGDCVDFDACQNLVGVQAVLPGGYKLTSDGLCMLDLLPITVTELLANPSGSDTGNEFIELYNPNETAIDLGLYRLQIGADAAKRYTFPEGSSIEAKSYKKLSGSDISFVLVNTSSQVAVLSADGTVLDESQPYSDPKDDLAWALIDGTWQYTNQLTPGQANAAMLIEADEVVTATSNLQACAANQYRNSETGRCRLIVIASSSLLPCKDGQYRSEETNRCRSIATDAATPAPCNANQERNPDTGRCRLIASADTAPAACKEGQERNPDTNRCRNIVKIVAADYPVEPIATNSGGNIGWFAVGGVGFLALGYGGWEWRMEIVQLFQKLRQFFHLAK